MKKFGTEFEHIKVENDNEEEKELFVKLKQILNMGEKWKAEG